MKSATMLYRAGDKPNESVWGLQVDYCVVDEDEVEAAMARGWYRHPHDIKPVALDDAVTPAKTAKEIEASLPDLSDDDLLALSDSEASGKARKGLLVAIEAEVARRTAPAEGEGI